MKYLWISEEVVCREALIACAFSTAVPVFCLCPVFVHVKEFYPRCIIFITVQIIATSSGYSIYAVLLVHVGAVRRSHKQRVKCTIGTGGIGKTIVAQSSVNVLL